MYPEDKLRSIMCTHMENIILCHDIFNNCPKVQETFLVSTVLILSRFLLISEPLGELTAEKPFNHMQSMVRQLKNTNSRNKLTQYLESLINVKSLLGIICENEKQEIMKSFIKNTIAELHKKYVEKRPQGIQADDGSYPFSLVQSLGIKAIEQSTLQAQSGSHTIKLAGK